MAQPGGSGGQNPLLVSSATLSRNKKFWDFITAFQSVWSVINYFALTGVIGILATVSFMGSAKLPDWFTGYILVPGFSLFAFTEGIAAIVAVVSFFKTGGEGNKTDLAILLTSIFGPGAACTGSILMVTGAAAANPIVAFVVSGLFIVALTFFAFKSILTYPQSHFRVTDATYTTDQRERDVNKRFFAMVAACFLSGFGVAALVAKLTAAASITVASFWVVAGVFGLVLIAITLVIAVVEIKKAKLQPQPQQQPQQQHRQQQQQQQSSASTSSYDSITENLLNPQSQLPSTQQQQQQQQQQIPSISITPPSPPVGTRIQQPSPQQQLQSQPQRQQQSSTSTSSPVTNTLLDQQRQQPQKHQQQERLKRQQQQQQKRLEKQQRQKEQRQKQQKEQEQEYQQLLQKLLPKRESAPQNQSNQPLEQKKEVLTQLFSQVGEAKQLLQSQQQQPLSQLLQQQLQSLRTLLQQQMCGGSTLPLDTLLFRKQQQLREQLCVLDLQSRGELLCIKDPLSLEELRQLWELQEQLQKLQLQLKSLQVQLPTQSQSSSFLYSSSSTH
jgi:hypothetical protein